MPFREEDLSDKVLLFWTGWDGNALLIGDFTKAEKRCFSAIICAASLPPTTRRLSLSPKITNLLAVGFTTPGDAAFDTNAQRCAEWAAKIAWSGLHHVHGPLD